MIIKQLPAELSLAIKGFDTIEIYLVSLLFVLNIKFLKNVSGNL